LRFARVVVGQLKAGTSFVFVEFSFFDDGGVNYCKDCGMPMDEVKKYDYDETINEITGEVTWKNNHPCNPNAPGFS